MTRQNVTEGVREILTKTCPTCEGEGVVLSEETVAIDTERKLREVAAERSGPAFLIQVHPRVATLVAGGPGRPLLQIEEETGKLFHFEGSEGLPLDHFAISMEGKLEEIEERALPFREGEEVLVTIEEPHMYSEDDAVAKLDGYVISVARAVKLIGKKTLVRIESVGRSAASATLVEGAEIIDAAPKSKPSTKQPPARPRRSPARPKKAPADAEPKAEESKADAPESAPAASNGNGDEPEEKPKRRRGRRGGRGRRKKTETTGD
jgi:ribonuclease G